MKRWLALGVFMVWTLAQQSALPTPPGWQEVAGPAGTMCSDGSPWKFFVAKGDPKKVIVDFQGGGACWADGTCAPESTTFSRRVGIGELYGAQGLYNRASFQNPFVGWTHVFVPYCTADLHIGNVSRQYRTATIQHKGAVNARAAVDWVGQNYREPEQVLVTGCSAGSYGSIAWAPYLMRLFPLARVTQFGDAGLGVIHPEFQKTGFANWNVSDWLPDFIPELGALKADPGQLQMPALYGAVARAYPTNVLSQFSTALDSTQIFFYSLMKGEREPNQATALEWSQGALGNLASIKKAAPNTYSYLAPGSQHCVIPRPEFYTTRVGETALTDWLRQLVASGKVADVAPSR
jgi:hypothetical protein